MMDNLVVRNLLAVIAGVVVAACVVGAVEMAGHAIFPPPPGLDLARPEDQARLMEAVPLEAKLTVVLAWFLGALAGAATAIAIARRVVSGWVVGVVIAAMGLWTTQMFPHPDWMLASAVVLPLVAVLVAKRLMAGRLAAA